VPYKDPERQREAQRRQYQRKKELYRQRQRERREDPTYRFPEYAKRLGVPVEQYEAERDRHAAERKQQVAARAAARERVKAERAMQRQTKPRVPRQPSQRAKRVITAEEEQALIDKQRQMREDALAWLAKKKRERVA
jgi:hypothetical protein